MARAGYGDLEVGAETSSVQAVHPVGSAAAPGIAFSTDTDVGLYRAGANQLGISAGGTGQVAIIDGVLQPVTTNDIDLGTASLQFKNAWFDGTLEADAITIGGSSVTAGTNAATVTVIDSTDTSAYVALFDSATGSLAAKTDAGVTYNAGTGMLTATGFTGPLTGALQTASQTNITAVGTITSGTWEGTTVAVDQGGTGATTLNNLVTLGTHTTGNYAATVANATNGGTTIANSGSETAAITVALDFDDLTAATVNVAADSIPFLDADGTASRKESIADFVSAIAGTNVTASSGQLSVPSATVFTRAPAFFMS